MPVRVGIDPGSQRSVNRSAQRWSQFHQASEMFGRRAGEEIVTEFSKRLEFVLSKEGPLNIGATETAMYNFIDSITAKGPSFTAVIQETQNTKANYFIRHGSSPGNYETAPLNKIADWAMHKGLNLGTEDDPGDFERGVYLVARHIMKHGISEWREYQTGQRWYEYMDDVADWQKTDQKYRQDVTIKELLYKHTLNLIICLEER
jgi:hypothetical protein